MADQPLERGVGAAHEGLEDDPYLRRVERSGASLPGPSRDASAAFVLGIMGFATCGLLSPLAIYYGHRALSDSNLIGGRFSPTGRNARFGQIMGLVGTTFLVTQIALTLIFGMRAWGLVSDLWSDFDLSQPTAG